ncbi:hypothetical protein D9613_002841 [Agrocybe pediades]|uniref:Uncharacterized protein n=1 Tax=Agrocybe pediades TaxID=84607 RepID=A0A8H4QR14_9AGAR|nr:hypothetical protein D9613_002841 [Agrocybe pediades]
MSANFSPTPAELSIVSQIFANADPQKLGVLTGDVAVRVFGGAKLSPTILGEIWNISDEDNNGWLSKKGVAIAVRLIGWAQKGEPISQALLKKPGPLPVIEGIAPLTQQNTGMSLPKSPPPPAFPPLTPQDKAKFQSMFVKYGPTNGVLSGEKARDIFVKSKLSHEQLMKIWNLADTQDRGALDATDFAIGMYFIQGVMTGKISFIPTSLPPGLYQQAGGGSADSIRPQMTGTSGSFSPVTSAFLPQHTGQASSLQPDYTGSFKPPTLPARPSALGNGSSVEWDVTPAEKISSDRHFDSLDTQKKNYIEGEVAVPFMLKSQLPGEVLAQIWDLADINNDGRLTRDGFAIAMHLIQKKLAGKDIPVSLPPSLVPPSARATGVGASPFSPLHDQVYKQPEPVVDLFSFEDSPASAVPVQATHFPASVASHPTGPPKSFSPAPVSDPFFGSSNQPRHHDLLGDDDMPATTSPPLQDQSAEIGNLKNQLQSTNKSLAVVKEERETLEQTLANQASLLSTIQTQLSSAKAAYETETSLLAAFKERRATQITDIQKNREELIRAESDLSAVRVEKAEIEGALLRDKEEARELHKRMVEVGQQAEALKADVEKLKKEAKQQKGLLAIARKQLSTKENEKAKAEREHEEAVAELTSVTAEKDAVEAEIANLNATQDKEKSPLPSSPSPSNSLAFAAAQPLPMTPDLSGPSKSNNPFERLALSSGNSTPRSQSPFMSLANTIISSPPPIPNGGLTSDGLAPTEEGSHSKDIGDKDKEPETELFYLADEDTPARGPEAVLSPNTATATEFFMTPPTSANNDADSLKERFPSLDDLPSVAPVVSKGPSPVPPAASAPQNVYENDLNSQVKELEIEDSDSDSDDQHDVQVAAKPTNVVSTIQTASPAPEVAPSQNTFDDVFGSDEHAGSSFGDNAKEHAEPAINFSNALPEVQPQALSVVAGVNEFDEALGKLPPSTTATPATFTFDAAFDDNFDFASASKVAEPVNGVEQKGNAKQADLDDIFAAPSASVPTIMSGPSDKGGNAKFETSFDEAFSGFDTKPALQLSDNVVATSPISQPENTVPTTGPAATPAQSTPSTILASPMAAGSTARAPDTKSISSPPRTKSPPPRVVSPHPRVSTSSSKEVKEVHEKHKEPSRTSKLSIRLPFGKKKKTQDAMPSSSHLTPPIEQPHRANTPASEDDVEAVKQLTAMGFSRSQAVDALEKCAYDVPKALNSLLGGQ